MRIRSVKPDFWRDRDTTGRWPIDMKLVYVGLWCVADDEGRFEFDPDLLSADLDPFRTIPDLMGVLERIRQTGCLVTYESGGQTFGFLPNFSKHQKPNKPSPSRLPDPPVQLPEDYRSPTVALPPGEEGRGVGEEAERSARSEQSPAGGLPAATLTEQTPTQATGTVTASGPVAAKDPVDAFQRQLEARMCRTAPLPLGGDGSVLKHIAASLQRLPIADAVELVYRRDVEACRSGSQASRPRTLKLVAAMLADEVSRRANTRSDRRRRAVGVDAQGQPIFEESTP